MLKFKKIKLPNFKTGPKQVVSFFWSQKILWLGLLIFSGFIAASLHIRSQLIAQTLKSVSPNDSILQALASPSPDTSTPSESTPSASEAPSTPSDNSVLGASTTTTDPSTQSVAYTPPTAPVTPSTSAIDPSHSSISSNAVPADGSSKSNVTVTLENSSGQALAGLMVSLSSPGVNFSPSSAGTDSGGHANFSATSYSGGPNSVSATVSGDTISIGSITFNSLGSSGSGSSSSPTSTPAPSSPTPDKGHSSLSAGSAPANGSSKSTVSINLKDGNGNPITFYKVSLSSSDGGFHYSVINSTITDGGGNISLAAYHDVYTGSGNLSDSIDVTATDSNGHSTTLSGLGQVTFTSLGTPPPTTSPSPSGT